MNPISKLRIGYVHINHALLFCYYSHSREDSENSKDIINFNLEFLYQMNEKNINCRNIYVFLKDFL